MERGIAALVNEGDDGQYRQRIPDQRRPQHVVAVYAVFIENVGEFCEEGIGIHGKISVPEDRQSVAEKRESRCETTQWGIWGFWQIQKEYQAFSGMGKEPSGEPLESRVAQLFTAA